MASQADHARAYRQRNLARRIRVNGRWIAPLPPDEHGKPGTYHNHGCQCDLCRKAAADYARARRTRRATS